MNESFNVGDKAVYPAHGVAEVVGLETKEIGGSQQSFYILKIMETGMKVMIPTTNAHAVGLREVVSSDEVDEVMLILESDEIAVEGQPWNRRYREYMDKIKTGSVFEVAEVYRDLTLIANGKDLSFGERKMLETARQLLVKELAVAKATNEANIEQQLAGIFQPHRSARA